MAFNIVLKGSGTTFNIPLIAATPASASGAVGTVTASAPAGTATVAASVSAALATVAASAPAAAGSGAATRAAALVTVAASAPAASVAASSGVAAVLATVTTTAPAAAATGAAAKAAALPTLALTAPAASAGVSVVAAAALATVAVSAPAAAASVAAQAVGAGPLVVTVSGDIGGQGQASATVVVPLADGVLTVSAPAGAAIGAAQALAALPVVTVIQAEAQKAATATGLLAGLSLSPPAGFAEQVAHPAAGALASVTVAAPAASAAGAAQASIVKAGDDFLTLARLVAPRASVVSGDQGVLVSFPNDFLVSAPEATASPAVLAGGDVATVAVAAPAAAGTVAIAVSPANIGDPSDPYWARLALVAPAGSAAAAAAVVANLPPAIQVSAPAAITFMGATVLVALPQALTIAAPAGAAGVVIDADLSDSGIQVNKVTGTAQEIITAYAALPVVALAAPQATASVDGVVIDPPGGGASGGASVGVQMPVLAVTTPAASAAGGALHLALRSFALMAPQANVQAGEAAFATGDLPTVLLVTPDAEAEAGAQVSVGLPGVYLVAAEGWADDSRPGHVRLRRTQVPGRAPVTVAVREIVLNEADGALSVRAADGGVLTTPLAAVNAALLPEGGTSGQVLTLDGWADLEPAYVTPLRQPPAPGDTVGLGEARADAVQAQVQPGATIYRPFFVPRAITLAALAVDVTVAASATATLSIVPWTLSNVAGPSLGSVSVDCATAGLRAAPLDLTLPTGWYAAVIAVAGAAAPTFAGVKAPGGVGDDFQPEAAVAVVQAEIA